MKNKPDVHLKIGLILGLIAGIMILSADLYLIFSPFRTKVFSILSIIPSFFILGGCILTYTGKRNVGRNLIIVFSVFSFLLLGAWVLVLTKGNIFTLLSLLIIFIGASLGLISGALIPKK